MGNETLYWDGLSNLLPKDKNTVLLNLNEQVIRKQQELLFTFCPIIVKIF